MSNNIDDIPTQINLIFPGTSLSGRQTIIIGAGMAGLAAAIGLSARGEKVLVVEKESHPGGKMRRRQIDGRAVDAGPTVLTMKWVFDRLFETAGARLEEEVDLEKAAILARHAWDDSEAFDLFADRKRSADEIARIFGADNAAGYRRFCNDSRAVFETLKDTFITASRPGPIELGRRIGLLNLPRLLALRPFQTLWRALGGYFPDPRLRQLFGRYATYVGSSPFSAPATLMLIAHVEQEAVWLARGGMHELALAMTKLARKQGAEISYGQDVREITTGGGRATGVQLESGEHLGADCVVYCGDVSRLANGRFVNHAISIEAVGDAKRSLSAITWTGVAKTAGFPLQRHNVFFSREYQREFAQIFSEGNVPDEPTIYVCAQDRDGEADFSDCMEERLLCLINAPAFGDRRRLSREELSSCEERVFARLQRCGLEVDRRNGQFEITQPADFETLFPGSGGALYGRASHGWMASFARPGTRTRIAGLYLAGGSVHPGAGVPMATLSGMLAAQQIMTDRASI